MFNKPSPAAYYGVFQGEKPLFSEMFTNLYQNGTKVSDWELQDYIGLTQDLLQSYPTLPD